MMRLMWRQLFLGGSAAQRTARQNDFSVSHNPIYWVIGTGVLLVCAVVFGTVLMVLTFRDRAIESSKHDLDNTVALLARHFDHQFDELARIRKGVSAHLSKNGIVSAQSFSDQGYSHDTHLMLKAQRNDEASGDLALVDANGILINWSASWPVPEASIAASDYFQTLKHSLSAEDEILQPVISPTTGRWMTLFARKIVGSDGTFFGLVTRSIEPQDFERFFASVIQGRNFTLSLHHRNGLMLARYPNDGSLEENYTTMQPLLDHIRRTDKPLARLIGDGDSEQLATVRTLRHFPAAVIATSTIDLILKNWREQTRFLVVVAALTALIILALLYLIFREVSEQHRASQAELTIEKKRLDTAINNMSQGLLLFDSAARMVISNQSYMQMYNLSPTVVKPGCHFRDIIRHRQEQGSFAGDVDAYCDNVMLQISRQKKGQRRSTTMQTADGRYIHVLDGILPDGGWVATHEDITERRRTEERIAHLAHYDALTDLPNRSLFHSRLEHELSLLLRGQQCAVIYIDIDEFKGINDSLGHTVGDDLLKTVAQRLRSCVRERDVVARLGGDEFAIVITDVTSQDEVAEVIARIHETIREPAECQGHRLITDASIGIAIAPRDGHQLDQLLKNADLAMYSAKADGRRTHRFFEPEMDARVKARRALELDLREVVEHGDFRAAGFEIYYQPLVSLNSNAITGCEALLRWWHPERGMVSPADFIPVAEDIGVISAIGEWVLNTACKEAATWPNAIKVAVNVSPVQFRNSALALKVIGALAASELPAHRLELEITEAVLIRDDEAALTILHQLRAIGVRIALDDFGTGYSSLSYLHRFPFDKIKIDRCFVSTLADENSSNAIVQAVVNIATSRNMTTTAEGVETGEQRETLRSLGCTEMQGYLFSPPKPAIEVQKLMQKAAQAANANNNEDCAATG